MTVVDGKARTDELVELAARDRRVAKELAGAERERLAAVQRREDQDAAAQRRLLEAEGRLRLTSQKDEIKANRKQRRADERAQARADKRARKQARREARAAWVKGKIRYARENAAAVYSSVIYGLAVSGAVYGQIDAARLHHFPLPAAIVAAAAIEGTGLAMALTAQQQRLRGERAMAARALVWIATAAAVAINYVGHQSDWTKAVGLSVLSAIGIVVFEIRSGAKHRAELRKLKMIPEPGETFGLARWLTYPGETFAAWRLGIRDRLSPGAAALIARVEQHRIERRRRALQAAEDKRKRDLVDEVGRRARKAIRKSKDDSGAVLAALTRLAQTGTPAPLLALPSTAHVEADNARAEAEASRRARVEAEAAAAQWEQLYEAEAEARAAAEQRVWAEAEARAAAEQLAEAEAGRVREALAAKAEAEAAVRTALEQVRAEVAQAAQWRTRAEVVADERDRALRQVEAEVERRVEAEARAVAAEAFADTDRNLSPSVRLANRRRRTASASGPGEPLLFEGLPVPAVDGVGAATVLKVLTERKRNPEATQSDLAAATGVSDRTVRLVLAATKKEAAA